MEELNAALKAAGYESFTPNFDGVFQWVDEPTVKWFLGWAVTDDYDQIVHREYMLSLGAGAIERKEVGEPVILPPALIAKVDAIRGKMYMKTAEGMTGIPELECEELPEDCGSEEFIPVPEHVIEAWSDLGLTLNANGAAINNADNALKILEGTDKLKGRVWLDDFANNIMTNVGCYEGEKREWTDNDTRALWLETQRRMGIPRMSKEAVWEAILAYAFQNRRHPVKQWLGGLSWDRVPRIETFFRDFMGAEDTKFTRAACQNFFVAMIARVYKPGCKMDNMVVLEGDQGAKKSSALKALIGADWFTECNEPISNGNNKDFYAVLQGKMLVEIAELDSFSRADTKRIKAIISTASDRYRPAYGRLAQTFPRTSVFVGTTNEEEYLEDATGARRFWPVKVGALNIPLIEQWREQLFAEALARYKAGATWWEVPKEEAAAAQEERRKVDMWEEEISTWIAEEDRQLKTTPEPLTINRVAKGALGMDVERMDRMAMLRIAYCLKVIGYRSVNRRIGGQQVKQWIKRA